MSSKIFRALCLSAAAFVVAIAPVSAQFLYPNYMMPKVSTPWEDTPYDSVLLMTWRGVKATLVDAYPTGLVHRPKSNRPGDAVSEGVSYGMFLALYMNDQAYFNKIWEAGVARMWVGGEGNNYYDWRVDPQGNRYHGPGDRGPASDADQDIALLLIFADELVKNGIWNRYTGSVQGGYAGHARQILHCIRTSMVDAGRYLMPGRWGGRDPHGDNRDIKNPGYFAPAFYRVFAEFEPEHKAAWDAIIDGSYEMIEKSPGYARGLLPDWTTISGASTGGAGYNAYHGGDAMYRDAIRIHWRLATDYLWYKEPRAKAFLDNAMNFLESSTVGNKGGKSGPAAANFYTMAGNLLPENDVEVLEMGGRDIVRGRREHSHLTLGMWAAAAMGSGGPALAQKYSDALLGFYQPGTTYFGHPVDTTGGRVIASGVDVDGNTYPNITVKEDTLHNEMYFDQFLAWFGASILAGNFTNVWDDLKDGVPQGPPTWKTRPPNILPNWNINASVEPFTFGASFSRAVRWSVELKHEETGAVRVFSGSSDSANVVWYGTNSTGGYMPQGWYTLTLSASGLEYQTQVWLGRPFSNTPNLLRNNRLLVDDFADNDRFPYIGTEWRVHTDRDHDGGNSTAEITVTGQRLRWSYTLDRPHWKFATLDWTTATPMNFGNNAVDTLIFMASSQKAGLEVSLQLLSADFNIPHEYQFFEHRITIGTTPQLFRIPLNAANFSQRLDGSGKNLGTTLSQMTGIRFHVQYDDGTETTHHSGAITLDSMLFSGTNITALYTPPQQPPAYIPPDREPQVNIVHRARRPQGFSIQRAGNTIRLTVPQNMAGASVSMIDIRGRTVKRMAVPPTGTVNITTKNLAAGMYFVEVKKRGVKPVRVPLGSVR